MLEAIARLHAGAPRDPDLQARARARKLRVNATTATLEAGCARRLAYAFPRVRLALAIDHEAGPGDAGTAPRVERKSLQEIVIQLRHDNAELRRGRDKAVSMAATMVIRMRNMERDVNKEVRKSRRNAKRAKNDNQVVGNVYRLRPDDGEPGLKEVGLPDIVAALKPCRVARSAEWRAQPGVGPTRMTGKLRDIAQGPQRPFLASMRSICDNSAHGTGSDKRVNVGMV